MEGHATQQQWNSTTTVAQVLQSLSTQLQLTFPGTIDMRFLRVRVWVSQKGVESEITQTVGLQPYGLFSAKASERGTFPSIVKSPTATRPAALGFVWPRPHQITNWTANSSANDVLFQVFGNQGGPSTDIVVLIRVLWRASDSGVAMNGEEVKLYSYKNQPPRMSPTTSRHRSEDSADEVDDAELDEQLSQLTLS